MGRLKILSIALAVVAGSYVALDMYMDSLPTCDDWLERAMVINACVAGQKCFLTTDDLREMNRVAAGIRNTCRRSQ